MVLLAQSLTNRIGELDAERELSLNFDEYDEKLANSSLSVSFSQSPSPSIMFESAPPSWSIDVGFGARRRRCLFEFVAVLEALTFMAVVTAQLSVFFFSESGDRRCRVVLSRIFETKSSPDVLFDVDEDDDDEHDEELDSSESSWL